MFYKNAEPVDLWNIPATTTCALLIEWAMYSALFLLSHSPVQNLWSIMFTIRHLEPNTPVTSLFLNYFTTT